MNSSSLGSTKDLSKSELSQIWLTIPQVRVRLGLPSDDSTRRQLSRWADDLEDYDRRGLGREKRVRLSAICKRLQGTRFAEAVLGIESECIDFSSSAISGNEQPKFVEIPVAAPILSTAKLATPPAREHVSRLESVAEEWKTAPHTIELDQPMSLPPIELEMNSESLKQARLILDNGLFSGWQEDEKIPLSHVYVANSGLHSGDSLELQRVASTGQIVASTREHQSRDGALRSIDASTQLCEQRKPLSSMSDREFAEYCRYMQEQTGRVNESALPKFPIDDKETGADDDFDFTSARKNTVKHNPRPVESQNFHYSGAAVVPLDRSKRQNIVTKISRSIGKWFGVKESDVSPQSAALRCETTRVFALTARPNRLVKG